MATVTETYILEQNEGMTTYPDASRARLQASIDSGAVVSRTVTPITDPGEVVAGKTRATVVIVYRSEEDRQQIWNVNLADATLQSYLTASGHRKINRTLT